VFLRFQTTLALVFLTFAFAAVGFAQTDASPTPTPAAPTPTATATPAPAATKPAAAPTPVGKNDPRAVTAEQVIESSILFYTLGLGRPMLSQVRKSTFERGKTTYTNAEGKAELATYQRFVIRAEKLAKEKVRLDQDFPNARYSLVFSDEKIYGIYNNTVFTPREDASKGFENQIVHGLDAYFRYRENESKVELGQREKIMGVDFYVVDVTDQQERKTRFYISVKQFRVMMLTYEEGGVKYRRKFYDYNYAQGILFPFRTVLWADDKMVEETEIGTVTFGQKVNEELFKAG